MVRVTVVRDYVDIPDDVTVVVEGYKVTVKGPKGRSPETLVLLIRSG